MKKLLICVLLLVMLPACTFSLRTRFILSSSARHIPAKTFHPTANGHFCVFNNAKGERMDYTWEAGPFNRYREGTSWIYYKAPWGAVSVCCISGNGVALFSVPRGPNLGYTCVSTSIGPSK
jgi:hypothetical protein